MALRLRFIAGFCLERSPAGYNGATVNFRALILGCALLTMATCAMADEPGPPKIPGLVEGPITVSPWFVASQPKPSAARDHYMFSVPPLLYCGFGGWPAYGYTF